jgi:hypothetical protein
MWMPQPRSAGEGKTWHQCGVPRVTNPVVQWVHVNSPSSDLPRGLTQRTSDQGSIDTGCNMCEEAWVQGSADSMLTIEPA